jgi:hypothetical protein
LPGGALLQLFGAFNGALVWECWQWYWVFTAVVLVLLESMETPKGFVEVFIFIGVFESSACIFVRC